MDTIRLAVQESNVKDMRWHFCSSLPMNNSAITFMGRLAGLRKFSMEERFCFKRMWWQAKTGATKNGFNAVMVTLGRVGGALY